MKEDNEVHGTEYFQLFNCIGYQMISTDKLDDCALASDNNSQLTVQPLQTLW